jgi:mono/diheme cytochrome c family protein
MRQHALPILFAAMLAFAQSAAAEPTPERQKYLRDLVNNECTRCHGPKRIGQNGPPLLPENLEYIDKEYLMQVILNGRYTLMPPWKGMLSEDDVAFIVNVVLMEPAP